ncbi:TetR/AcrR family transcriptional regulator [Amycolatopsis sp. NPDC059657]|uniref:TetR/AcrR family transcriptional regulator n=1 Tax=Amycolatopsis sp. NPDC059657 TaxID=3346899 RepID=UPI00366F2DAF
MPETPPGLSLRERKKFETHRTLARAAVRLVAEHGLDKVTVEDIAAAADVSVRTFFNYFASKDDAVVIAYPDRDERTVAVIEALLAAPPEVGTAHALLNALDDDFKRVEDNRDEWLARMSIFEQNLHLVSRMMVAQAESERQLVEAIARRCGLDPDKDFYPSLLFSLVGAGMSAAIRRWHALGGKASLRELLDEAMDAVVNGLPEPH